MFRDPVQSRGPGVSGPVLFGALDPIPVGPDLVDVPHPGIAEDVGVAADQFVDQDLGHLIEVEGFAFAGQLAVKDDLEEEIPQFLQHLPVVPRLDRIQELVNLLHGMKPERLMVLFTVPRTTLRRPEQGHDFGELSQGSQPAGGWTMHGTRFVKAPPGRRDAPPHPRRHLHRAARRSHGG